MELRNGKDAETYDEKINRVAMHIKVTNLGYNPKPIQFYFRESENTSDVNVIIDRIKTATRRSRIVVFKVKNSLNCCFADTVGGQYLVKNNKKVVGVYDGSMNIGDITRQLKQLVKGD